jgi:hypothetical protein
MYNLIGNVMPHSGVPINAPFRHSVHIPSKQRIARSALSRNPTAFQLREVGFKEANLVLAVNARRVCCGPHNAEMVPYSPCSNCRRSLRDKFSSSHRLPIPIRRAVKRDLGSLDTARVCRIFVGGRKVNIRCDWGGAVLVKISI